MEDYIEQAIRTESLDKFNVARPRLLHAGLGITGELCELLSAAWNDDKENLKEETGDVFWYLAVAAQDLGVSFDQLRSLGTVTAWDWEHDPGEALSQILGGFPDVLKRGCFYGVEFDEVTFGRHLGNTLRFLDVVLKNQGWTEAEVQTANIAKLKKRYPKKFTTEDAVNRDVAAEMEAISGSQ